jgi:hypothetical protein
MMMFNKTYETKKKKLILRIFSGNSFGGLRYSASKLFEIAFA